MSRLPFDPDRAKGAPDAPPPDHLTVSQASQLIKSTLERSVESPLRVIGEISNLSTPGHWYFSLKDADAVLSCVAWASSVRRFDFTPRVGDEVVATGHVSYYPPQGRTQLYVNALAPVGAGALEQRFQALCRELRGLGYFDDAAKQPLPFLPRRVAVITSASGAAVHDVIDTAARRCRAVGLVIVDVRVQGDGAAEAIADAIEWVDEEHERLAVDAILVTRGGGSMEDLWAFNERVVADAAWNCRLPLVAAIGHESDTTVIELVADVRAATPTQAAMRLVPSADDLSKQTMHLCDRLRLVTRRQLERRRHRVEAVSRAAIFRDPVTIFRRARNDLDRTMRDQRRLVETSIARGRSRLEHAVATLRRHRLEVASERDHVAAAEGRLVRATRRWVTRLRARLDAQSRLLDAADPKRLLERGYSITSRPGGMIVRSVDDVRPGVALRTQVIDGVIKSTVGGRASRGRARKGGVDQLDLFLE